jgi:hypothetical protein
LIKKIASPVRASHHAILATHALLRINGDDPILSASGGSCGTLFFTFGFTAMHTGHRKESEFTVRIFSHLEFKDPVEEDSFGSGMFCPAGHRAGITSDASLQIDHHSIPCHQLSPRDFYNILMFFNLDAIVRQSRMLDKF